MTQTLKGAFASALEYLFLSYLLRADLNPSLCAWHQPCCFAFCNIMVRS